MKAMVALLLMGAVACGGKAAPVQEPAPARVLTPAEVVEAGKGALEQYRQAWEVRSFEALAPLYAQDLDVVVVHQGEVRRGWTAVEKWMRAVLGRAAEIHINLDNVSVTALGTGGAAAVASMKLEVNDGTAAVIEQGTLTLSFRKDGDRWLIVHEHFSYSPR